MAEKKNPPAGGRVEKLVDEIAGLSVLELSELTKALQDKLGVSPMSMVSAAPAAATDSGSGEAKPMAGAVQTVVMTASGANKIAVIKALREINSQLGLKEAKDMTEKLPAEVLKDAKAEEAKTASEKLKAAGATVELK